MASDSSGAAAAVLRDEVVPQVAAGLMAVPPPRWRGWAEVVAIVAAFAALLVGVLAGVAAGLREVAAVAAVLMPVVVLVGVPLWVRWLRRRVRRSDAVVVDAGALRQALAPYGVRELTVVVSRNPRLAGGGGRAWRCGGRAVIALRPEITASVPRTRFTTAHEAAHLTRHDSLGAPVLAGCAIGLVEAAVVGLSAHAWLLGVAAVAAVAVPWWREFDCDRVATAAAGPEAAEAFRSLLHRLVLHLRGLPWGRRVLVVTRAWLTHPPSTLRGAAIGRALRRGGRKCAVHARPP